MVAFSIRASSMCGVEKQKRKEEKERCVKADVSLIHSGSERKRERSVVQPEPPTASLLPGPRPGSAAPCLLVVLIRQ